MKRLLEIYKEHQKEILTDGEALDNVLNILTTMQPTLRDKIMNTDGEEMSDAEALQIVNDYYQIDKLLKENNNIDVIIENTIKLSKENLKYIFKQQNISWDGDMDGSYIEDIDHAVKGYIRIGLDKDKNVIYFKKSEFDKYLNTLSLDKKLCFIQSEIDAFNDDGQGEYEIHENGCYDIINDFCKVEIFYVNSFDYIRDYFNVIEYSDTKNSSQSIRDGFYTEDEKGEVLFINCTKLTSNREQMVEIANSLNKNDLDGGNYER